MKKIVLIFIAAAMVLSLCSCSATEIKEKIKDVIEEGEETLKDEKDTEHNDNRENPKPVVKSSEDAARDFALKLFCECFDKEKNSMVSPVSVMYALGMLANGAKGETLAEMEEAFGMTSAEANEFLLAYAKSLEAEGDAKISVANSVWIKDDDKLTVKDGFLDTCGKFYDSAVFTEKFGPDTCTKINEWIEDHTDGLIKDMLDKIPEDAVMYLVNAIGFEAKWADVYYEHSVIKDKFTNIAGEKKDVEYMLSTEYSYLCDESATGFIKPYEDGRFAFAALLPNEDVKLADYAKSLTGEKLKALLAGAEETKVSAWLPKFASEYEINMNGVLNDLGIKTAFDENKADFSDMAEYEKLNIFVSRVLHKSYIEVAEQGTKAGAATVVEMKCGAAPSQEKPKEVHLTRPFVYVIFDTESYMPLFIGCENDI